jgi:hypothetical protein
MMGEIGRVAWLLWVAALAASLVASAALAWRAFAGDPSAGEAPGRDRRRKAG